VRAVPAFIAFDFDHDEDLRNLLAGQSEHPDTPFSIRDQSVKRALSGDWREKVRARVRDVEVMIVICGEFTHLATGIGDEIEIAREEGKRYFLLWGRNGRPCTKPSSARADDKIYTWTWPNLKSLVGGAR
jgi:hypothetical protein